MLGFLKRSNEIRTEESGSLEAKVSYCSQMRGREKEKQR